MSEVITFTSGKGGVGKTTTTANVGVGLSQLDKKVVLVDTDIGLRNLDVVMGLENRILYHLLDVLSGKCRLKQALIRDWQNENLFIIPSPLKTRGYKVTPEQMKHFTDELREMFDYILIDSPAGIEEGFYNAIAGADRAIVVTTPHIAAIHDADQVLQCLKEEKVPKVELLLNRYQAKMVKNGDMLSKDDICELLQVPLIGTIPEDTQIVIAQNHGESVMNKRTDAKEAYRSLCLSILGRSEETASKREMKVNFFSVFQRRKEGQLT